MIVAGVSGSGGERGEEETVHPGGQGVGGGKAREFSVGLGQQWVAPRGRREQTVGGADHDDHVDVETDGTGEGPDGDAVADPALARRAGLEFGLEGAPELTVAGQPRKGKDLGPRPNLLQRLPVASHDAAREEAGKRRGMVRRQRNGPGDPVSGGRVWALSFKDAPRYRMLSAPLAGFKAASASVVVPESGRVLGTLVEAADALYFDARDGNVKKLFKLAIYAGIAGVIAWFWYFNT